jgi:hypothetical protein
MAEKKMIEFELWRKDRTHLQMTGRLLGLITSEQFALLIKDSSFRKRISTVATMDLKEIIGLETEEIVGKRLLFVAKELEAETVADPVLVMTEELEFVCHTKGDDDMAISGRKDGYMTLMEV